MGNESRKKKTRVINNKFGSRIHYASVQNVFFNNFETRFKTASTGREN